MTELSDLKRENLKDVVRRRLEGVDAGGPSLDGSEPIDWLVSSYREGDPSLRKTMDAVLEEFLHQLCDQKRWPDEAASNFLDLLQEIGDNISESVFSLARSASLIDSGRKNLHAGLLKCLISTQHKASPDFWWDQFDRLGPEFGALIASGLSDHGLEVVMKATPKLCEHETARNAYLFLWRHLVDQYGLASVARALQSIRRELPATTYELYIADLERLGLGSKTNRTGASLDPKTLAIVSQALAIKSMQPSFSLFVATHVHVEECNEELMTA